MKRFFLPVLLVIGLLASVSCERQKNKWSKFFGYTHDDIVGTYSFSNVKDAFDGLEEVEETHHCDLCDDAQITIAAISDRTIRFSINCPSANFARDYIGSASINSSDFKIDMTTGFLFSGSKIRAYNLMAYVYKNEAQQVRLHGFASADVYGLVPTGIPQVNDTVKTSSHTYYFDVIKN